MNTDTSNKVLSLEPLLARIRELRKGGTSIVSANGAFDILHAGHVYFLETAKRQGDILVVGINSDTSVNLYKSTVRPFITENDRARMVAALACVDLVFIFDESDPCLWLSKLKPDVHVNGAEYGMDCIERKTVEEGGGHIHLIKPIAGLSTTNIVKRIVEGYTLDAAPKTTRVE